MSKTLVERLREQYAQFGMSHPQFNLEVMLNAADRIEELEAENKQLRWLLEQRGVNVEQEFRLCKREVSNE